MVLEMENSRRPFDRSRDPGPMKKPRIAEEPIRPPNPNTRQFPAQRPLGSVAVPSSFRFRGGGREAESNNSGDPSREAYQPQPVNPHHELVSQYKSALSELTFNSKPIITNLTIIAGENLHAAKAIVATICNNILEVPSDQKLPSLYLLDSIVKNIGRDYIKYFAARLPEVFIKAYRQVDPPTHSSMRHLFGTWKGVFHPQTLQIIEKELGFTSRSDGSPSVVPTTRADPQAQRPPHSIHVNPKYLERQRLQQSGRAKGMVTDVPGNIPNSMADSDRLDRASSLTAGGSWMDPSVKMNSMRRAQREPLGEPLYEKDVGSIPGEYDYASDLPQNSGLGIKKGNLRIAEEGREKQWYGARGNVSEMIPGMRDSLSSKSRIPLSSTARLANSDLGASGRSSISVSNSWKNSEEEEFMWDMHTRLSETDVAHIDPKTELWAPDEPERLEPENHLLRPARVQDAGPRFDSENLTASYSADQRDQNAYGRWISSPRSLQDSLIQRNSEGYSSMVGGLPPISGTSVVARKGIQPPVSRARAANSVPVSDRRSPIHDPTSLQNSAKQDFRRTNSLPQRDPRATRFPAKPQSISRDDSARSLSSSSQFRNTQVLGPPDASQAKTLESLPVTENAPGLPDPAVSEASGQPDMSNLLAVVMKSGILSNNLTSSMTKEAHFRDEEKPRSRQCVQQSLSADLPRTLSRPVPASLPSAGAGENLSTHVKIEAPSSLPGSTSPAPTSKQNIKASDPISSLLSSLVSKGLITASKAESPSLLQSQVPSAVQDHSPDHSTNSSMSAASAVPTDFQSVPLVDRGPSAAPKSKGSASPSETTKAEPGDLIGLQFRPDKIREFHPSVINSLFDDLPHQCTFCGIRLKHDEQLVKHLELHDKKKLEASKANGKTCAWFPKADDWVAGNSGQLELEPDGISSEPERATEDGLRVPADENQCACILCGGMFEEFFSQETDQWMFKGAVYMTDPLADTDAEGPIVHAICLSDSSAQDLVLSSRVKQENDV